MHLVSADDGTMTASITAILTNDVTVTSCTDNQSQIRISEPSKTSNFILVFNIVAYVRI